jgi:hypothetical protein
MARHHRVKTWGLRRVWRPFLKALYSKADSGGCFREQPILDVAINDLNALADRMSKQRSDDSPNIPAGFTYLGQFVGPDVTVDPNSVSSYYFLICLPRGVGERRGF